VRTLHFNRAKGSVLKVEMTAQLRSLTAVKTEACRLSRVAYLHIWHTTHKFFSLGMSSDWGLGLVAGYQTACDMALWVADYFHEFRDLFELLHQLERKASPLPRSY